MRNTNWFQEKMLNVQIFTTFANKYKAQWVDHMHTSEKFYPPGFIPEGKFESFLQDWERLFS